MLPTPQYIHILPLIIIISMCFQVHGKHHSPAMIDHEQSVNDSWTPFPHNQYIDYRQCHIYIWMGNYIGVVCCLDPFPWAFPWYIAQFVTVIAMYGFVSSLAPTLLSSLTQTISSQLINTTTICDKWCRSADHLQKLSLYSIAQVLRLPQSILQPTYCPSVWHPVQPFKRKCKATFWCTHTTLLQMHMQTHSQTSHHKRLTACSGLPSRYSQICLNSSA